MATRTTTITTDDIDGSSGGNIRTVQFGFDGTDYEIDLNEEHRDQMREALQPYLAAARAAGRARGKGGRAPATGAVVDSRAMRAWARDNGIAISERGRISAEIRAQYLRANG